MPRVGRHPGIDDVAAYLAQGRDALAGAAVDGLLHQRHEQQLRQQEGRAQHQRPRLEEGHVADHAHQDAALQQRLGDRRADEAADRLDLGHGHGGVDSGLLGVRGIALVPGQGNAGVLDGLPQGSHGVLGYPAAIDVERQLETLLEERDAGIGDRQPQDGARGAALDGVVDDAPLQFERHGAQPEYRRRQRRESKLVNARFSDHVADDRPRQDGPVHIPLTPAGGACSQPSRPPPFTIPAPPWR